MLIDKYAFMLASDPDTDLKTLVELSKSPDVEIRAAIAYNKSTPENILNQLRKDSSNLVRAALRKRGVLVGDALTVCIAGKNNIAVNGLKHIIDNYSEEFNICYLPNPSDDGIDTWQLSFLKFANEHNIPRASLEELYLLENLIFISLEYSEILKTKKFKTHQLYNIHFSLLPKYKGMYTSALPIFLAKKNPV